MSKQTINLGTPPTGVGGDTPRSAFTKAQSNFDEIYTALGAAGSPAALPTALPVANGGTGGTTQVAARTALGLKSAAVADIVGTVSQSGGLPTGSILERGSNASGEYLKFADGTLICYGSGSGTTGTDSVNLYGAGGVTYASVSVPFPANFIDTNYSFVAKSKARGMVELCFSRTTSGCSIQVRHASASQLVDFDFVVCGRWV